MRYIALVTPLLLVVAARGQEPVETTVWLTILGEGGAEEVTIGPEGGLVPYTLFVETDPLGSPENFGLAMVSITVDTDTVWPQLPAAQFEEPFDIWLRFGGLALDDDIIGISASQVSSGGARHRPNPRIPFPGVGQSGPQPFAHGNLRIGWVPVGAAIGQVFHASIFVDPGAPASSSASVYAGDTIFSGTRRADVVVGGTLAIRVVPEPSSAALFVVGSLGLARLRRRSPRTTSRDRHATNRQGTRP